MSATGARPLRVGIDAHALGRRQTGNERFLENLIPALAGRSDCEVVAFVDRGGSVAALPAAVEVYPIGARNGAIRQAWSLPRAARGARIDVFLGQYLVPARLRCPSVAVVHDVSFASHPEWFSPTERRWMRRLIPASMGRAHRVVTVSEFSRGEIIAHYGIDPSKVIVAHDGVDPRFSTARPSTTDTGPPYVVAVGNVTPRKNLVTLVRAYALLAGRRPDLEHDLVIVGQDRFGAGDVHLAAAPLPTRVRFLGYVSDQRLLDLVANATALAYPSRYEGFGLPVVEAMAAGTPTIVSDIPVMAEVAADAALRVPPGDVPGWADALDRVMNDADLRVRLTRLGRERAAHFTWESCADRVLEALRSAVERRS